MSRVHSEITDDLILTRARNFGFGNVDENPELKTSVIRLARAVIQDDRDLPDTYEKEAPAKPAKGGKKAAKEETTDAATEDLIGDAPVETEAEASDAPQTAANKTK